MYRRKVVFIVLIAMLLLPGCGKKSGTGDESVEIIARVDDTEITLDELSQKLYPQGRPESVEANPELADTVLQQLIDRALIINWASKNKIKISEEEVDARLDIIKADYSEGNIDKYLKQQGMDLQQLRARIEGDLVVERVIAKEVSSKIEVGDDEIEKYYKEHGKEYESPDEYHIKQIITDTQKDAEDALTAIEYGTPFEQVAADKSVAPDRYAGGDVGYVPLNALPPTVAETIKTLPEGEISPVIETEYGYFLVKVEAKKEGGAVPIDEVSDEIYGKIHETKEIKIYTKWLGGLRAAANIKIEENLLKSL
jgi:parvulin-like peptidyl-prolyl isomerase